MRCDNASIVSALDKGRAKNVNLAIIIRLIVRAMIEAGTILKFWKTGKEKVARVEYISSKGNILADNLSRGRIQDCLKIANKLRSFKQVRKMLSGESERAWRDAVNKITENMATERTQGRQPKQV